MTATVGGLVPTPPNNTTTFLRGDATFAAPSSGGTTVTAYAPRSLHGNTTTGVAYSVNTTARGFLFFLPVTIVVNKISIRTDTVTTAGVVDIAIYSLDGQTKHFEVTTASLAVGDTIYTTAVSAVTLTPGLYYIFAVPNGTMNLGLVCEAEDNFFNVASEPKSSGTLTVTAGTLPATFVDGDITAANRQGPCFRLDN